MPDEPRPQDAPKDDDLDAELSEFEAELFKAAEGIPKTSLESEDEPDGQIPDLPTEEEIEARLSKVIKEAEEFLGPIRHDPNLIGAEEEKRQFGDFDPEFNERLDGFSKKVDKIKATREEQSRQQERRNRSDRDSSRGLGVGISIAYTIIGLPLLGAAIGWFADGRGANNFWTGIGTLIGAVIGVVAGIAIMNRSITDK